MEYNFDIEYIISDVKDKDLFWNFFKKNFCIDKNPLGTVQYLPDKSALNFYLEFSTKFGHSLKIYKDSKLIGICICYFLDYISDTKSTKLLYIHYLVLDKLVKNKGIYESIIKSICEFTNMEFYYLKHYINQDYNLATNSIIANPLKMYMVPINIYRLFKLGFLEDTKSKYKYQVGTLNIINNNPKMILKLFKKHLKKFSCRPNISKNIMKLIFTKNCVVISDNIEFLCKIDIGNLIYKENKLIILKTGILNILIDPNNNFATYSDQIFTLLLNLGVDQLILKQELGDFDIYKIEINNFEEYIMSDSIFCDSGVEFFNF